MMMEEGGGVVHEGVGSYMCSSDKESIMVVRSFDLGGKEGTRGFFVFFSSLSNFPPRHVLLPRCSFYEYGTCSGWLADTIILEQIYY